MQARASSVSSRMSSRAITKIVHTTTESDGHVTACVRRTQLPSGLRIVTEEMVGARSASIGIWVGVGSRDETATTHGCSHFLEHLLFKGTKGRTALDISIEMDAVGGEFNAFTAKEYTCYHARVLDEDLPLAIDVLGDMLTDSVITAADVDAERDVILDEIAMHDDDPDDVVQNLLAELAWGAESPLGRPIAGTEQSIAAMTPAQIKRFYRRHYVPANTVISVAGSLDHQAVVKAVRRAFGRSGWLEESAAPAAPRRSARRPQVDGGDSTAVRPFEQVNLVIGREGLDHDDDRRYALGVLNTALGGGTSSRLFQEIREQRGLAYSVYSFASQYADSGLVGVAVGCLPDRTAEVLDVVRDQLELISRDGISDAELSRSKSQLVGGMILGLEDSGSRMMRIGKNELVHGDLLALEEVTARIRSVTLEDVRRVAAEVFCRPELLAIVGPVRT